MTDEAMRDEIARLRAENETLRGELDKARATSKVVVAEALECFRYWVQRCHKQRAKFTGDRRSKVLSRLREGYTVADIKKGIDGAAIGAFISSSGQRFDDLALICRSGSKLEDFMDRADLGRGPSIGAVL